jgi:CDP-paratose 2-epimerase
MKILVTGGAGFIGCNLAAFYLKKGCKVIVFDNLSRKGVEKNLKWLRLNHKTGLTFIKNDIRNFNSIKEAAEGVDLILHTAAQVAVTSSVKNPREDFEINTLGTFNILEAARQCNTSPTIIFCSTNKVYGDNVNKIPLVEKETRYEFSYPKFIDGISEDFPTDANEHTPYGASKYAADTYVRDYSSTFGLKTVTFRLSCIYGIRQFGNEDQGWLAHFVISTLFGRQLVIYGDGKQVRDILFIDDLVNAFDLAYRNIGKTKGQVYNIGGGPKNTISLIELLNLLKDFGLKVRYKIDDWRPADQKVYISNIKKANEFGWKPKIPPKTGIKMLLEWVSENKRLF